MSVLLLGKHGQLGRELQRTLLPFSTVIAIGRDDCDLANLTALRALLKRHNPHIIVNAAAYTAVDKAQSEVKTADIINNVVVAVLADFCQNTNALLVHYSTDYVFDGLKSAAYLPSDKPNPQNIYGQSKRAGEQAILQSNCDFLLFRTSWVYSSWGNNFIKTILTAAKKKSELKVVADQYGAPTSAELIADITAIAIASYRQQQLNPGIYHLTAAGKISWHDLACYALEKAQESGVKFAIKAPIISIPTDQYPLPAKRPMNSTLDTTTLETALKIKLPHWTIYVDRLINQLIDRNFFI